MAAIKVTQRRSIIGNIYYWLIRLSSIKNKLATDSFKQLHSYEDVKTPAKKGYLKEAFGNTEVYCILPEKQKNGALLFLPGGGFVIGPSALHWRYLQNLAKKLDMAVLVFRYPLAPEFPFPVALNGITNAITAMQKRGLLPLNWYLAGDSAGGNLTLSVCYELYRLKAALPGKIMLLYPSVDMVADINPDFEKNIQSDVVLSPGFTRKVLEAYAGKHNLTDPLLSPVNGEITVLPPVLLQHGTADMLIRGSEKLAEKLQAAGKPLRFEKYTGMFHGFIMMPGLPEAKKAFASQVKFLQQQSDKK